MPHYGQRVSTGSDLPESYNSYLLSQHPVQVVSNSFFTFESISLWIVVLMATQLEFTDKSCDHAGSYGTSPTVLRSSVPLISTKKPGNKSIRQISLQNNAPRLLILITKVILIK